MVDSFKFLPRSIGAFYKQTAQQPAYPIPFTPLAKPLAACTFALVTSGGLYVKGEQEPFDMAHEVANPTWGDPSFRPIPTEIELNKIGVSHLHLNTDNITADPDTVLPLTHFKELAESGVIGALAAEAYSFMGFQGFPPDLEPWCETYAPQVITRLKEQQVDCILLTPT